MSLSSVDIVILSSGALRIMSEIIFDPKTIPPSSSTFASICVVIPSSRSYPHSVTLFFSVF